MQLLYKKERDYNDLHPLHNLCMEKEKRVTYKEIHPIHDFCTVQKDMREREYKNLEPQQKLYTENLVEWKIYQKSGPLPISCTKNWKKIIYKNV